MRMMEGENGGGSSIVCGDFNFCSTSKENQILRPPFIDLWPTLHPPLDDNLNDNLNNNLNDNINNNNNNNNDDNNEILKNKLISSKLSSEEIINNEKNYSKGWTEDTYINKMRFNMKGEHKQVRFDRLLLFNQRNDFSELFLEPKSIHLIGTLSINNNNNNNNHNNIQNNIINNNEFDEVFPSDHFGLFATFILNK